MPKPQFIRSLRAGQTQAEQRLWYHFRAHRFLGLKIKRQKQLGPYIADFVCMELKLVIEADGGQHGEEADRRRDAWFARNGFTMLRSWNNEVLGQTEAVLEKVREVAIRLGHMDAPALSPGPSPARGRGEQTGAGSKREARGGRRKRMPGHVSPPAAEVTSAGGAAMLPSPACGRGEGGEGRRLPGPPRVEMPARQDASEQQGPREP